MGAGSSLSHSHYPEPDQSSPFPYPTSWISLLIISSHLTPRILSGIFPLLLSIKTLYTLLMSPIRARACMCVCMPVSHLYSEGLIYLMSLLTLAVTPDFISSDKMYICVLGISSFSVSAACLFGTGPVIACSQYWCSSYLAVTGTVLTAPLCASYTLANTSRKYPQPIRQVLLSDDNLRIYGVG